MSDAERSRLRERARGCLLGAALGDAFGGSIEFLDLEAIREKHPRGVHLPEPALITDDTQLTLFTANGLISEAVTGGTGHLWAAHQRWLRTQGPVDPFPDTGDWLLGHRQLWTARSPAASCVSALQAGRPGRPDEPVNNSKGSSGMVRTTPAGFLPDPGTAYRVGCEAAALTEGHPTGWIAGGVLALVTHLCAVRDLPLTVALLEAEHQVSREPAGAEVRDALAEAVSLARRAPGETALVTSLGEGWNADETLAIAAYAVLSHPTDVPAALRLAVTHSGNSDSTGAVAGAILGAALGVTALPPQWLTRLELADLIGTVADDLVAVHLGEHDDLRDRY